MMLERGNERPIVYFEKFLAVVYMDDLGISDGGFHATATPLIEIPRPRPYRRMLRKVWNFGCSWGFLSLHEESLSALYVGWTIWTNPKWVDRIHSLVEAGEGPEAHEIVMESWGK